MSEKETAGQMYTRLGMDGYLWAKEFVKTFPNFDEETARAWFCSAIMAGYDKAIFRMAGEVKNVGVENAKLLAVVEAYKHNPCRHSSGQDACDVCETIARLEAVK